VLFAVVTGFPTLFLVDWAYVGLTSDFCGAARLSSSSLSMFVTLTLPAGRGEENLVHMIP
jgi:hypothetical protein